MIAARDVRRLSAQLIFDLQDAYARLRGVRGPHPNAIGPLRLLVTGRLNGAIIDPIDPPWELVVRRNSGGYLAFFGHARRRPEPPLRAGVRQAPQPLLQRVLADGTYEVRVESGFYQPAVRSDVVLPEPRAPYVFDLEPGYAYPFPSASSVAGGNGPTLLRGALHDADGTGVAGAVVEALGLAPRCLTERTGQWVLVFDDGQPSAAVTVRVTYANGSVVDVPNVQLTQGHAEGLAQTALAGLVTTAAGVALAGARVQVGGHPRSTRVAADGSWTYYFGLDQPADSVNVTAVLPDGRSSTVAGVQVTPRETTPVAPFRFA